MMVYGPSKPNTLTSIKGGITPTTSMAGSREKLDMDPWIGQHHVVDYVGRTFSRDQRLCPSLLTAS
jgi:hypothetical protein